MTGNVCVMQRRQSSHTFRDTTRRHRVVCSRPKESQQTNVYETPPRTFLCLSKHQILSCHFDHIFGDVCIWLISKLRSTCINRRRMTRKLPQVMRTMELDNKNCACFSAYDISS